MEPLPRRRNRFFDCRRQFILRHRGADKQFLPRPVTQPDRLPAVLRRHRDAHLHVAFRIPHLPDHAGDN